MKPVVPTFTPVNRCCHRRGIYKCKGCVVPDADDSSFVPLTDNLHGLPKGNLIVCLPCGRLPTENACDPVPPMCSEAVEVDRTGSVNGSPQNDARASTVSPYELFNSLPPSTSLNTSR